MSNADLLLIVLTLPIVYTTMILAMFNYEYKKTLRRALKNAPKDLKK